MQGVRLNDGGEVHVMVLKRTYIINTLKEKCPRMTGTFFLLIMKYGP